MITCISPPGHELQTPQCTMLGWLTLAAMKHLGSDTPHIDGDKNISQMRTARIGTVALVEQLAGAQSLRCIHCLRVSVTKFSPPRRDGLRFDKKFYLDSSRLLYSWQYEHNATPPDVELRLYKDPRRWFDPVCFALLAAIRRHNPQLLDWQAMPKDITAKLNVHDIFHAVGV